MKSPRVYLTLFFLLPILGVLLAADRPNPMKLDDPSLRLVNTKHYQIHTDLDQSLVTELSGRMDAMYEQYAKSFSDFALPDNAPPLPVYLFDSHQKYVAFTDYAGVNTGGLFVAGRHPFLTAYLHGQGRDALRRSLQHEAFHQFAHAAIARQLPPWMNEGMAQCFEESIWTGNGFLPDQIPPRRLRQLQLDITQKRLVDFDQFMNMSPQDWSATLHSDLKKAASAYNQAWAMAYFCSSAGAPQYHDAFLKLLTALHADDGWPGDATRKFFPDLKDFRQRFNTWAAKVKPTLEAMMVEHQETLGDFLLALQKNRIAIPADMASFRSMAIKYNLKIQYTRGSVTYSTADRPASYFEDETGRPFKPDVLYLEKSDGKLPDILCKTAKLTYRTHFYSSAGDGEHETLVTPTE